jgi:protein-tyrosine-phosphatase
MCGMNAVRSPIAEAAGAAAPAANSLRRLGRRAGRRARPVRRQRCWRGRPQRSATRSPALLDELEDDYFDLIVTLAPEAHHAALELTRSMAVDVEYWPTPDPTVATGTREQIMHAYRDVRDRLKARISGAVCAGYAAIDKKRVSQGGLRRFHIGSAQIPAGPRRPQVKGNECRRKKSSNFRAS